MTQEQPPTDEPPDEEETASKGRRFTARDEDFSGANDEALLIKLSILEEEHRDLDSAIHALENDAPYDRLAIARLKKKKLKLKDSIQEIKDALTPDIIA
ncbi:MAG: YdcH family protein [Parvularculaceae bacterium]